MMAESIKRSTPRCVWGFTLAASFRSIALIWAAFQSTTPLGLAAHSEDAHARTRTSIVLMIGQYTTAGGRLPRRPGGHCDILYLDARPKEASMEIDRRAFFAG